MLNFLESLNFTESSGHVAGSLLGCGSVRVTQIPAPPPAARGVPSNLQSSCVSASGRFHV